MNNSESSNKALAEQYVSETVLRLQKSFKLTAIAAAAILIVEITYFSFLNNKIEEGLTAIPEIVDAYRDDFDKVNEMAQELPEVSTYSNELSKVRATLAIINGSDNETNTASRLASKIVHELNTQELLITEYSSELMADSLGNLPDWIHTQIPKHSEELQEKVDLWIKQYCIATSDELGSTFDAFIESHEDQIKEFSEATDDNTALEKLDEELTEEIAVFMRTTPIENYGSLQDQSDRFLARLQAANALLKPLANEKRENLSPSEKELRRAIGIFMNKVNAINLKNE